METESCLSDHLVAQSCFNLKCVDFRLKSALISSCNRKFRFGVLKKEHILLIIPMQCFISFILQESEIAKFKTCAVQCTYFAKGYFFKICVLTPLKFPLIEAAPSYPCPRIFIGSRPNSHVRSGRIPKLKALPPRSASIGRP